MHSRCNILCGITSCLHVHLSVCRVFLLYIIRHTYIINRRVIEMIPRGLTARVRDIPFQETCRGHLRWGWGKYWLRVFLGQVHDPVIRMRKIAYIYFPHFGSGAVRGVVNIEVYETCIIYILLYSSICFLRVHTFY